MRQALGGAQLSNQAGRRCMSCWGGTRCPIIPADEASCVAVIVRWTGLLIGAGAALALGLLPLLLAPDALQVQRAAVAGAVALLMIVWWCTGALPMALTACVPLLAWPLLGVSGGGAVADLRLAAEPFFDSYTGLYLGGMTIGVAMESSGLHRRIALRVMHIIGTSPARLLLGVLVATALVSAWISNTATAVMMLPIASALVLQMEGTASKRGLPAFATASLLAVAYGANVGGIATKIGSATNSIFAGHWERTSGTPLAFLTYSLAAVPFLLLFLPLVWWVLWRVARRDAVDAEAADTALREQLAALGKMGGAEKRTALLFTCACALWIFGDLLRPALNAACAWNLEAKHYEALVSLSVATVLVLLRCVSWPLFRSMPFSALLLLGGSFSMAAGLKAGGATEAAAAGFSELMGTTASLQMLVTAAAAVLLSALASNTATITLLVNVLPLKLPLMLVATFGCSCDFMLPAGTPPNAIVYSTGRVPLRTMLACGWRLDLAAILVLWAYGCFVIQPWFG